MALAQTGPYLGRSVWVALDSFVGGPKSSASRSFSPLKLLFGGIPWYTAFSEKPIHHVVGCIIIYPIDPYSNYPISHYSPIYSWLDSHYTNGLPITVRFSFAIYSNSKPPYLKAYCTGDPSVPPEGPIKGVQVAQIFVAVWLAW